MGRLHQAHGEDRKEPPLYTQRPQKRKKATRKSKNLFRPEWRIGRFPHSLCIYVTEVLRAALRCLGHNDEGLLAH